MSLPQLTQACAPLTHEITAINEHGQSDRISIPAERALTLYVDKRELVTLMTLGAQPELLCLGYLLNQRLIACAQKLASITVDWDVGAAAVRTHTGIADVQERTARRVVTTGCGQGSVFGDLMEHIDTLHLPPAHISQAQLYDVVNTMRLQESTYKSAGSVHGCALFDMSAEQARMLVFVEDVGRHNAIDTIAGWMAMHLGYLSQEPAESSQRTGAGVDQHPGAQAWALNGNALFYTTGRLTSEMVIKAAQMGVPIVVSRSGITQMGHQIAQRIGLCTIGRATNKRYLCYSAPERLRGQ